MNTKVRLGVTSYVQDDVWILEKDYRGDCGYCSGLLREETKTVATSAFAEGQGERRFGAVVN
ncbi:MAG: hypothetical protein WC980_05070 [Candidatus Brocadiia bacterium]